jgi:sugar phosphate permease
MNATPAARFYGWRLLAVLFFVYAALVGVCFYGAPTLFPLMVKELEWGRTEVSVGFTVAVFASGAAAPLAAWCISQWGARWTTTVGCMLTVLGAMMMAFTTSVIEYILYFGVAVGIGLGLGGTLAVQTVVTFWFERNRGLALGLVLSGGAVGGFVAPMVITAILGATDDNWRMGWMAIAVFMVAASAMAMLFIRNKPADLGQQPDGGEANASKRTARGGERWKAAIYRTNECWTLQQAMRTRQFWYLTLTTVGVFFIWYVLVTQGTLHLQDKGFSREAYGTIYGITTGLTIVGRLGAGFLSDRIDPTHIMTGAVVCSIVGSVLFWFVTPTNVIALSYPLFSGVAMGAAAVALSNIISNYWGVGAFAAVYGMILPIMTVFNSVAAPFAGFIYDRNGNYFYALVSCWVLLGAALIAMLCMRPPRTDWV